MQKLYSETSISNIADAIRAKGGTGTFTVGEMAQAIEDLPSGGGEWTTDGIGTNTEPSGAIQFNGTSIGAYAFAYKPITSVNAPNLTSIGSYGFYRCTSLVSANFPNVTTISSNAFQNTSNAVSMIFPSLVNCPNSQAFRECTAILVFPKLKITNQTNALSMYQGRIIDFGEDYYQMNGWTFNGMGGNLFPLNTMIFRRTEGLVSLASMNGFPIYQFSANGSGGTVYIPKVLYDHLGDGTSLDYLSATNWATLMSYNANNTFACIEGSQYENYYADGTPIE